MIDRFAVRPARRSDLPDCARVWHAATEDYLALLNTQAPPLVMSLVVGLLEHLLAAAPSQFTVAIEDGSGPEAGRIAGFGAALQRDEVWFLSMLFVEPASQGLGLGKALLSSVLPRAARPDEADETRRGAGVLATCTDAVQPISNGLYAGLGIVPRMPALNLVGRPDPATLPALPAGVVAQRLDAAMGQPAEVAPAAALALDAIDRATVGYAHPADHAFWRASERIPFLYRTSDGAPLGYGYADPVGRLGPVALLDETLTPAVLGHLFASVEPRGASSCWVPGGNDRAFVALLRAGLRIEGFPVLLCWTRQFAAFERYLPSGPALL